MSAPTPHLPRAASNTCQPTGVPELSGRQRSRAGVGPTGSRWGKPAWPSFCPGMLSPAHPQLCGESSGVRGRGTRRGDGAASKGSSAPLRVYPTCIPGGRRDPGPPFWLYHRHGRNEKDLLYSASWKKGTTGWSGASRGQQGGLGHPKLSWTDSYFFLLLVFLLSIMCSPFSLTSSRVRTRPSSLSGKSKGSRGERGCGATSTVTRGRCSGTWALPWHDGIWQSFALGGWLGYGRGAAADGRAGSRLGTLLGVTKSDRCPRSGCWQRAAAPLCPCKRPPGKGSSTRPAPPSPRPGNQVTTLGQAVKGTDTISLPGMDAWTPQEPGQPWGHAHWETQEPCWAKASAQGPKAGPARMVPGLQGGPRHHG